MYLFSLGEIGELRLKPTAGLTANEQAAQAGDEEKPIEARISVQNADGVG